MTIGLLLVVILIVGAVLYFFPGIDATLRKLLVAVCVILTLVWIYFLLARLGLFGDDIFGRRI